MKILHTSDWHLGRTLYSKKERQEEHSAFLAWLINTIKENSIDLLLVAGDIFDTSSPSTTAQRMYYDFLVKVRATGCANVIVVGGNHDSPSFLNAPKDILAALKVTVIGNATENIEDEIIVVNDQNENPAIIVCAVPFLRERDISRFVEGESYSDRSERVFKSIKKHYEEIAKLAEYRRKKIGKQIPIIATGHLSVSEGHRNEDDGVRETYIGNIQAVSSNLFPDTFDYVALGHYHIPSAIKEHIRYCGSPIPMGFGESTQTKCVYIIDYTSTKAIETIEIPVFQKLASIAGDKAAIKLALDQLKQADTSVWVELIYNGNDVFSDLPTWIDEQIKDSKIEILKLQDRQHLIEALTTNDTTNSLDELDVFAVFDKLLDKADISDEQKEELKESYNETVSSLQTTE